MNDAKLKSKMTTDGQYELILELCQAIVVTKNTKEAAHLLQDLLSKSEVERIARRLKIAKLLMSGVNFKDIQKYLKTGMTTISKINSWLTLSGRGYQMVVARTKKSSPSVTREGMEEIWRMMKRRYPSYFWPQILLEDIFKKASKQQQDELVTIINKFAQKKKIFAEIDSETAMNFIGS